jgi:SAM-dependent methyltransferase
VDFLRASAGSVTCSEYWEDLAPGDVRGGVVCQDLEALTFPDACFDVCTHTEVLEHVADDAAAFAELLRVLAPGGWLLFTVPLFDRPVTVERASRGPGGIVHHLAPQYHDDRIRGAGRVLVVREYGHDVVDRLRAAGFESVEIRRPADATGLGHTVPVVVARRPAA